MFFNSKINEEGSLTFLKWYWKIIGIAVCILSLVCLPVLKHYFTNYVLTHAAMLKVQSERVLIIGLMLIAFSEEKVFDVIMVNQRQVFLVKGFAFAILSTCIFPLVNIMVGDIPVVMTSEAICRNSLIFFLLLFYWERYKLLKLSTLKDEKITTSAFMESVDVKK